MENKNKADLIVMIVIFLSALLIIVSGLDAFRQAPGTVFLGSSIIFAAALITRTVQWAGKE